MEDEERAALVNEIMQSNNCIVGTVRASATPVWIDLDLTMAQIKGLFSLSEVGTSTVSDLAEALGVGRPAASALVDRLFRLGLVEREEDEADRRRTFVRLSASGRHLVEQLRSVGEDLFRDWLKQLDDADLAAFAQGLRALRAVVMRQSTPTG